MGIKSIVARPWAIINRKMVRKWSQNPFPYQQRIFNRLIQSGKNTRFGEEHGFAAIKNYEDFKRNVPVVDYEKFKCYIDRIIQGERDITWPGKPLYFAKTSGTTSGVKYIPVTRDSISNHINSARTALLLYIAETKKTDFLDGKMIFLSGSPELEEVGGIKTGRLSGIVNHHVPAYLRGNQLPSYKTNCIENWEEKLSRIVDETVDQNMTLISGIPPWVQMYFDRLIERKNKKVGKIFPGFTLFIHGGVNYEPYKKSLEKSIGKPIDTIETYPASEGFFAFQNSQIDSGLLLNVNSGIFFEFIPVDEIAKDNPVRLCLEEVAIGVNYVLVVSSNAGLWAYNTGDTVKFVSKLPYKLRVTGRVKHFISAFGEHVIAEEVEQSLKYAADSEGVNILEFTVAPNMGSSQTLPHHEWLVEFESPPKDLNKFASIVDEQMRSRNIYYDDLIKGKILSALKIIEIRKGGFREYMKSKGKLGGQNKVPRLSNNREIADELKLWSIADKLDVRT